MIAQVILAAESFATDVALVRTFVGVSPFVYQQIVRLGEVSTAEPADELTSTTSHSKP